MPRPGQAEGGREPAEAYLADGLLAMAEAAAAPGQSRKAVPAKVIVRIDWDALIRGWTIEGEVCEVAGLGPVPVSVVRTMADSGDAFLAAVVTRGTDVATVAHLGRRPTAHQVTALQWRDPTCVVQGCHQSARLEMDHRKGFRPMIRGTRGIACGRHPWGREVTRRADDQLVA